MQTQKATHLCVAGLAFADSATPASSATFAAFLIAPANDNITCATPSSSCSASSLSTSCPPLRCSSPHPLFSPQPHTHIYTLPPLSFSSCSRTPLDTPVQQPPSRNGEAGRRPSSLQSQTYHPLLNSFPPLLSPTFTCLYQSSSNPLLWVSIKRRRRRYERVQCISSRTIFSPRP